MARQNAEKDAVIIKQNDEMARQNAEMARLHAEMARQLEINTAQFQYIIERLPSKPTAYKHNPDEDGATVPPPSAGELNYMGA